MFEVFENSFDSGVDVHLSTQSLRQKVKNGLVKEGLKQKSEDDKLRLIKKVESAKNDILWKEVASKYKVSKSECINKMVEVDIQIWKSELEERNTRRKETGKPDLVKDLQEISDRKKKEMEVSRTKILDGFNEKIVNYAIDAKTLKSKDINVDDERKNILAMADKKFSKRKNSIIKEMKKLFKDSYGVGIRKYSKTMEDGFSTDRANQLIANIPLKIDEQITKARDALDLLVGKALGTQVDSDLFDLDVLIELVNTTLSGTQKMLGPLQALIG